MECFARIFGTPGENVTVLDGMGHVGEFAGTGGGNYESPAGWYSTLFWNGANFTLTWPQKEVWTFDDNGRLLSVMNRNEMGYSCGYNDGDLVSLTDTMGRRVTLDYYSTRRVFSMSDWYEENGKRRWWFFGYSDSGDLASVVLPGTAQHDYEGPTYEFECQDSRITRLTAPDGVDICQNTYNAVTGDCISRAVGDGLGSVNTFAYNPGVTTHTSPMANVTDYFFPIGNPSVSTIREYTRGLRPGDPAFYDKSFLYNTQNEFSQVTHTRGNRDNFVFDEFNPLPESRGDILSHTRNPVPGDPSSPLVETWTHEPSYQFVKTYVSERGNAPGGTPAQYTTTYYYDYEEAWLGDLNGDGITTNKEGNVVKRSFPTVTMPAPLVVADTFSWFNGTGKIWEHTNTVGMITRCGYDAALNLSSQTEDFGGLGLTTTYVNNSVGLPKTVTDPNGNVFTNTWNERDQCVQTVGPAPSSYVTLRWFDIRSRLGRIDVENKDGNNSDQVTFHTQEIYATTLATAKKTYDLEARLIQIRSPEGDIIDIQRDERGLKFIRTVGFGTPDAASTQMDYDWNGDLITMTNPRGFATTYLQDGFGRRERETDPLTHFTTFAMDEEDHITQTARWDGVTVTMLQRTCFTTNWGGNTRPRSTSSLAGALRIPTPSRLSGTTPAAKWSRPRIPT